MSAAMSAASSPPKWVMLERFVFRMDDEKYFPDEKKLPIRASGTTWWRARFHIAFELAEPPAISRLYARLPGFPDPMKQVPLTILASHQHLVLFSVGILDERWALHQQLFIYSALGTDDEKDDTYDLKALPDCTLPDRPFMDYPIRCGRRRRGLRHRRRLHPPPPLNEEQPRRLMAVTSMGILCRDQKEFVVAELKLVEEGPEACADIFWLHKLDVSRSHTIEGKWNSCRVPIRSFCTNTKGIHSCCKKNPEEIHSYCCKRQSTDDTWQLLIWQTDAIIPVDCWLCWIDYYRGILFCDVFGDPNPTVSFLRLPLDKFPSYPVRGRPSSWLYRGASDIGGRKLRFVDVARHDGVGYGALQTSAGGFTITCHTLLLDTMEWDKDYTVTSEELWSKNAPNDLPRHILMFPEVDIYRPHVVHFLCCDYKHVMMKMWVVSIDMSTRIVESCSQYLNGFADLETDKVELTQEKSVCPLPFFRSEFSKFLKSGRPWAPARARAPLLTRAFIAAPSAASFKSHDAAHSAASYKTHGLMDAFKTRIAAPSAASSFKTRGLMDAL